MVEVVTFTGTLAHAGKHRVTAVLDRDVADQLHHVHGLAHTGATEQAHLTALGKRADQVDHLDAGFEQFVGSCQLVEGRGLAVNPPARFVADRAHFVDRVAQHVHDAAQRLGSNRHGNGGSGCSHGHAAAQAVCRTHCDGAHYTVAQLLLNFQREAHFFHF